MEEKMLTSGIASVEKPAAYFSIKERITLNVC